MNGTPFHLNWAIYDFLTGKTLGIFFVFDCVTLILHGYVLTSSLILHGLEQVAYLLFLNQCWLNSSGVSLNHSGQTAIHDETSICVSCSFVVNIYCIIPNFNCRIVFQIALSCPCYILLQLVHGDVQLHHTSLFPLYPIPRAPKWLTAWQCTISPVGLHLINRDQLNQRCDCGVGK